MTIDRNVKLLEDIAEQIEKHPDKHAQDTFCGSSQCIAGWAMVLSGEYELKNSGDNSWEGWNFFSKATGEIFDGDEIGVPARLLGLNYMEMDYIYNYVSQNLRSGLTWPEAITKIAHGANVVETLHGTEPEDDDPF